MKIELDIDEKYPDTDIKITAPRLTQDIEKIISFVVFVIVFSWFPIGDIKAWIGFLLSFAVCSCIGVFVGRMREQAENKKMEEALDKYRKKSGEL